MNQLDYEKRLPILIVPEGEMDFGGKSFDEPKIARCEYCGSALFYCAQRYGLVNKNLKWIDTIAVVGETEESKKFREWEIDYVSEERLCAVCKRPCGFINVRDDEDIAHEFEDQWDVERHEEALDLLQYPKETNTGKLLKYEREIDNIKQWIVNLERKRQEIKEYKEKQQVK